MLINNFAQNALPTALRSMSMALLLPTNLSILIPPKFKDRIQPSKDSCKSLLSKLMLTQHTVRVLGLLW
jgi:hypothetical protein